MCQLVDIKTNDRGLHLTGQRKKEADAEVLAKVVETQGGEVFHIMSILDISKVSPIKRGRHRKKKFDHRK